MSCQFRVPPFVKGQVMKSLFLTLTIGLPLLFTGASASLASDNKALIGVWQTHNSELIRFYSCGRGVCGKLITNRSGLKRDQHNPNPKLRKRAVRGLTIIRGRKKAGAQKWSGSIYNVKDGKTYAGSLKLTGRTRATVTGCMSGGLCQSATWRKISRTKVTALGK